MSDAPPLFGTPRQWAIDLAVMTGVGAFLGVIGPFGTYNAGPLEARLVYWIASMWIGFGILSITVRLSMRAASRWDLPVWFTLAAAVALGAPPLALLVGATQTTAFPSGGHGRPWPLLEQYGNVLALSEPCAFGFYFLVGRKWRGAAKGLQHSYRRVFPARPETAARAFSTACRRAWGGSCCACRWKTTMCGPTPPGAPT